MSYHKKIDFIKSKLAEYRSRNLKVFTSSSFQSHSIPLLHLLNQLEPGIPVYFLNTGFHFPETIQFKEQVAKELNLNVIDLQSLHAKISQRDSQGKFLFCSNPDRCCHINKILPMERIMIEKDVWIAGVRKNQNANRASFNFEEKSAFDTMRFHPILDWTDEMIQEYATDYNLPKHPLDNKGYVSIGCEPCTQKFDNIDMDVDRDGRWKGMKKTECGLHTQLVKK